MTRMLDWYINRNKAFAGWTHYEKWEYREDVLEGMKQKAEGVGVYVGIAVVYAVIMLWGFGMI